MSGKIASEGGADMKARFGLIAGHRISEFASACFRSASCSCNWTAKVERRGNAWAQTSKLRKLERKHLCEAGVAP